MLARAIALASLVSEDAAPLDALPEPLRVAARAARARLDALPRGARSATIARETIDLFAVPAPSMARRVLPRGLRTALAPVRPEPTTPPVEPGSWIARALAGAPSLGIRALARASTPDVDGTAPTLAAEVLRRLDHEEAVALVAARRAPVLPEDVHRSRLVLGAAHALAETASGSLARRVGLCRIAWAASVEQDGGARLAASLPAEDRSLAVRAADALWFAASEHAVLERARIVADLEESA